jgi:hypothetical protein
MSQQINIFGDNMQDLEGTLLNAISREGGRTVSREIIWFPKPSTDLKDMRDKLKIAMIQQQDLGFFRENEVANDLVNAGALTRRALSPQDIIDQYQGETTANRPHISSFRMQNRIFRFLGWTERVVDQANAYRVTQLGEQISKFTGYFPDQIGNLNERDLVIESLMNFTFFSINDELRYWDGRFRQRLFLNIIRMASIYGYITNNELVVTAFALKDDRDQAQIDKIVDRLYRLHNGAVTMPEAYKEVSVDPYNRSAVNNVYDSPKVALSLCRQSELLETKRVTNNELPANLSKFYKQMHQPRTELSTPQVVNCITPLGEEVLKREITKTSVWFDEL